MAVLRVFLSSLISSVILSIMVWVTIALSADGVLSSALSPYDLRISFFDLLSDILSLRVSLIVMIVV